MEESKMDKGSASGTAVTVTKLVSFRILIRSRPLPTRSSIYFQKNCITKTKRVMKNVAMKGPMKAFRINLSSFLITFYLQ
jgi:hypothetical protein